LAHKSILYCQKLSREENFVVAKNREIFSFSRELNFADGKNLISMKSNYVWLFSRNSSWRLNFFTLSKNSFRSPFFSIFTGEKYFFTISRNLISRFCEKTAKFALALRLIGGLGSLTNANAQGFGS